MLLGGVNFKLRCRFEGEIIIVYIFLKEGKSMEQKQQWGSRFGYLMVAAGASIGLGNIWKFPYLAYRGGGGVFLVVYLLVVLALAKPMVEMETAIGRHSGLDTVTAFECINPKWGFVGWIGNLCTIMINFYYVVVGGWVLRYLCQSWATSAAIPVPSLRASPLIPCSPSSGQ